MDLFEKAAAQENEHAQYELAQIHYLGGGGVKPDIQKAVSLCVRAAGRGHEDALQFVMLEWLR
jgi:TPR repeat protein